MIRIAIPRHTHSRIVAAAAVLAAHCATAPALAATYYVDFATGSDSASGLAPDSAWKRAPGDSRAGKVPRATRLQPGDTILFRGGVAYRGTIVIRTAGSADSPIRYVGDSWGGSPAILDGSEPAPAARPCRSARDCGGSPQWSGLYRLSLTGDTSPWDGLFQQDQALPIVASGKALAPGTASPMPGSGGRLVLVNPIPGVENRFTQGAGRVGFLIVAGGHVEIRGFEPVRFAPAARFGPYAGNAFVQLQPLEGILTALTGYHSIRHAPTAGPAMAGVTSGPI